MSYGLDYTDILQAYPGTTETDFAFGGTCGQDVINNEILRQYSKLQGILHPDVRKRINYISLLRVIVIDGEFELPDWLIPLVPGEITIYSISNFNCRNSYVDAYCPVDVSCLTPIDYTWDSETNVYVVNSAYTELRVSFRLSPNIPIESLKTLLRDMVACALGRRLYAAAQDGQDWSIVTYYCNAARDFLKMIDRSWVPPEFSDLDLLITQPAINSYRIIRNS